MLLHSLTAWLVLAGLLPVDPPPARISLELATLHVAGLTSARTADDKTDAPYLLVSVLRTGGRTSVRLPATGRWRLTEDAVVQPTVMDILELAPGDSARVVISVLESEATELAPEVAGATASTTALSAMAHPFLDPAGAAVAPVLVSLGQAGSRRIGVVSVLLTNEGGVTWWRRMECVEDCAVLKGLTPAAGASLATTTNGGFELNGAGGTYHLNLSLKAVN